MGERLPALIRAFQGVLCPSRLSRATWRRLCCSVKPPSTSAHPRIPFIQFRASAHPVLTVFAHQRTAFIQFALSRIHLFSSARPLHQVRAPAFHLLSCASSRLCPDGASRTRSRAPQFSSAVACARPRSAPPSLARGSVQCCRRSREAPSSTAIARARPRQFSRRLREAPSRYAIACARPSSRSRATPSSEFIQEQASNRQKKT